jgi:hypothetical protein
MYKARYAPYKPQLKGKKLEEVPAEIASHEIFRTVYPLNRCGSKQIIVGADPKAEFSPVIKIGRSGWAGIRLHQDGFKVLCESSDYITSFFDGKIKAGETFQISATEKVEFCQLYGKNLMFLSTSTGNGDTVCLAKISWIGFVNMIPAINHLVHNIESNQKNMTEIFVAYVKRFKAQTLTVDMSHSTFYLNRQDEFAATLQKIGLGDLQYTVNESFDASKFFYELQLFCVPEMYAYLPYV